MNHTTLITSSLLAIVPMAFLLAALAPGRPAFRRLEQASLLGLVSAASGAIAWTLSGAAPGGLALPWAVPGGAPGVHVDGITVVMVSLVTVLATALARYSRSAFDGDPGGPLAARWFAATLACTSTLVITNHLLVLALAWIGSSLSIHRLLTARPERPRALLAAREKFVVSRIAEVALLAALGLVASRLGTLTIRGVAEALAGGDVGGDAALSGAAVLVATAVVMKSAQLPFHGWITRVMEAPTPVSALLHAGVVNIGGLVLLRLAPLVQGQALAAGLLVAVGTTTALVGGMVMAGKRSVKAKLAWSTVAQMGFLLLQCGLGLWSLALLHLVAHSFYKAHAFLSAGSAVARGEVQSLARPGRPVGLVLRLGAAVVGVVLAVLLGAGFGIVDHAGGLALCVIAGLGLATLLVEGWARGSLSPAIAVCVVAAASISVWHLAFGSLVDDADLPMGLALAVCLAFCLAYTLRAVQASRPRGRLARTLSPALVAGLSLDHPLLVLIARGSTHRPGDAGLQES